MPESIPLRSKKPPKPTLRPDEDSGRSSSPVIVTGLDSRQLSRTSSPFADIPNDGKPSLDFDDWDEQDTSMPSDLRPDLGDTSGHRAPLLGTQKDEDQGSDDGMIRSTHHFHERDPISQAKYETRRKYTYAAITLALSLVSFTVQTETAVYIQHQLKWEKPYCMLSVLLSYPRPPSMLTSR
jgi:hypothetical protein